MKVINSASISPFGGLNFVIEEFDRIKVNMLLEAYLPELPKQSQYSWRDILYSFWSIFFCGGDRIEDLSENLHQAFSNHPHLKTPSPDSVLRRFKELACESQTYGTKTGKKEHNLNWNDSLNRLNMSLFKALSSNTEAITLDFDNTHIFTQKADAKMTYKKQFGYTPGVAICESQVIYVENRNGNCDPQTLQYKTLENMFTLLNEQQISIDIFRADGASYQLQTIALINKYCNRFFIRSRMSQAIERAIDRVEKWRPITIDGERAYRASVNITPFQTAAKTLKLEHELKEYRLVVTKIPRRDGQINIFTQEAYNYHAIITNDLNLSDDEVVFLYNQRGAIEKEFDVLKNDFGWSNLPFSKMNQNSVFLLFTAICRNLYHHIITQFSKQIKCLKPNYRIKKFIFRFICIPAKWIYKSRQWNLRVYGKVSFIT